MASRLYASGAVRSQKEAAEVAGISPAAFYQAKFHRTEVVDYINEIDRRINDGTVDMSKVLVTLGRKAVVQIATLMESETAKDDIKLKAAQDLADRSHETSKVQKHQIDAGVTLAADQVESLRRSLLESASVSQMFAHVADGDHVTTNDDSSQRLLRLVSGEVTSDPGG